MKTIARPKLASARRLSAVEMNNLHFKTSTTPVGSRRPNGGLAEAPSAPDIAVKLGSGPE